MIGWILALVAHAAPVDGRVLEKGTSHPLAGVEVVAGEVRAVTDDDGYFHLDLPDDVEAELLVQDLDHLPLTVRLTPPAQIKVFLTSVGAGYEIVIESFRETAHPTRHVVDAEQAYETPGTQDDVVRLVQSLPGVTVQREFSPTSGDLSVRGSAPGDNRYYLDGIEVPYLYHFNQYASVFPTSQLEGLELFPSTFGSRYGGAVGAVVDAHSRSDAPEGVEGAVSVNTIIAGADLRVPVGKKWWVAAAGRRSYQDLYSSSSDQFSTWPIFHDMAVRAQHQGERGTTAIFVTEASDRYARAAGELDLLDPVSAEGVPTFDFRRSFQIAGIKHDRRNGDRELSVVAAVVHDNLRASLSTGGEQRQRTVSLSSRLDASGPVGSKAGWSSGLVFRSSLTDLVIEGAGAEALVVAREAPGLARGADVDVVVPKVEAATYAQLRIPLGGPTLYPGVRVGLVTRPMRPMVEPRLAMRWQVADQTQIKAALGYYVQAPTVLDTVQGVGNPELGLTRSVQGSLGVEQTISGRLEIHVDSYHKELYDALLIRPGQAPDGGYRARATGVEAVVRYRLRDRFFLWGWGGLARNRTLDGSVWRANDYDQPVNLGLVASWDPNRKVNLAVRWRYGSGLPWTLVDDYVYNATSDSWLPVSGELNAQRMPAYTKLDLVFARKMTFDRWTLTLRAELWYVPRSANVLYPTYNYDWSEQGWVRGIPFLPLLGARATF